MCFISPASYVLLSCWASHCSREYLCKECVHNYNIYWATTFLETSTIYFFFVMKAYNCNICVNEWTWWESRTLCSTTIPLCCFTTPSSALLTAINIMSKAQCLPRIDAPIAVKVLPSKCCGQNVEKSGSNNTMNCTPPRVQIALCNLLAVLCSALMMQNSRKMLF